ncbi:ATP-dependent DNA helicase tlh1 [Leucoagaricus sp. SymC.cos]|nr:ATP-dependent DNA helicase tlh1 [Leucoagaricus sp. SymC.cos]
MPPIKYDCPHCAETLEAPSESQRQHHVSNCKPRAFKFGKKSVVPPRDEDGWFICKCNFFSCKHKYRCWKTIEAHSKIGGIEWLDDEVKVVEDSQRGYTGESYYTFNQLMADVVNRDDDGEVSEQYKKMCMKDKKQVDDSIKPVKGGDVIEKKSKKIAGLNDGNAKGASKPKETTKQARGPTKKDAKKVMNTKEKTDKRAIEDVENEDNDKIQIVDLRIWNQNVKTSAKKTVDAKKAADATRKPKGAATKEFAQGNSAKGKHDSVTSVPNATKETASKKTTAVETPSAKTVAAVEIADPPKHVLQPVKRGGRGHKLSKQLVLGPSLRRCDELQKFCLYFEENLRLFCCSTCCVYLTAGAALTHIKTLHSSCGIRGGDKEFQAICRKLDAATEFPPISTLSGCEAFPGLWLYTEALKCSVDNCYKVYTTAEAMSTHYNETHKGIKITWDWVVVPAQRLDNSSHATLFTIIPPPPPTPSSQVSKWAWLSETQNMIEVIVRPVKLDNPDPRNVSAWLKQTRWPFHAGDHQPEFLRSLVAPPGDSEFPQLKETIRFILDAAMLLINQTPRFILHKLATKDWQLGISHSPFHELQSEGSISDYATELTKFTAFLIRDKGEYKLPLPDAIVKLAKKIRRMTPIYPMPVLSLSSDFDQYTLLIVDLLIAIWTQPWDSSPENSIGDPTICYLALSSIRPDHGWALPARVTPVIARISFAIRSVFLFRVHHTESHPKDVHGAYKLLEPWHYEGEDSPFNDLATLQHLASSITYSTPSLPSFMWYNEQRTEFIWHGCKMTLSGLRLMARELQRLAYKTFTEDVLLGLPPRNDFGFIADDLSDASPHYGFIDDPRNAKYYDPNSFAKKILSHPTLSHHYCAGYQADGSPVWKQSALRRWGVDYSKLLLYLMAIIEVTGGSPSRGTEITCIQYRNTATRTRGLFILQKYLAIVCQYSKNTSNSGRDKLLPHGFDALCRSITLHCIFELHPFMMLVMHILFPLRTDILNLWYTNLFVKFDRKFTTEDLTSILKIVSLETMGVAVGVRDYRQLSVCVRRPHCSSLDDLIGLENVDTPAALQAGHTQATENRHYGITTSSISNLPEYAIEGYLKASEDWQVLLEIPPGFHSLSYELFEDKESWNRHILPARSPLLRSTSSGDHGRPFSAAEVFQGAITEQEMLDARLDNHRIGMAVDNEVDMSGEMGSESDGSGDEGETVKVVNDGDVDRGDAAAMDIEPDIQVKETSTIQVARAKKTDEKYMSKDEMERKALQEMRTFLKKSSANWASDKQRKAVLAAVKGGRDIFVALPTGGGKSLVPIITSAFRKHRTTVIINPFISLQHDWYRKLTEGGKSVAIYESGMTSIPHIEFLLVTTNLAVTIDFTSCIQQAHLQERVGIIVVEEGHEVFFSSSYRSCMKKMWEIRGVGCQFILLSGTLPIHMEPRLITELYMTPNLKVIRASSNRPNLQYILHPLEGIASLQHERLKKIIYAEKPDLGERG